jgi:hypothetical protein
LVRLEFAGDCEALDVTFSLFYVRFHIGEYYLSQMERCSTTQVPKNLIIIPAHDGRFNDMLSPVAFFVLLLTFDVSRLESAVIIDPRNFRSCYQGSTQVELVRGVDVSSHWKWSAYAPVYDRFSRQQSNQSLYFHRPAMLEASSQPSSCVNLSPTNAAMYIGQAPVLANDWFHSSQSIATVHSRIDRLCSAEVSHRLLLLNSVLIRTNPEVVGNPSAHKLVIYLRDANRKFANFDAAFEQIIRVADGMEPSDDINDNSNNNIWNQYFVRHRRKQHFSKNVMLYQGKRWSVYIVKHVENINPCLLHEILKDADMMLTTHGFQCMGKYKIH